MIFLQLFRFLKISALTALTSKDLFECLQTCLVGDPELDTLAIDISRVTGVATDGASVMSGDLTGVGKRVEDVAEGTVRIHCLPHRLQLAVSQAAASWGALNEDFEAAIGGLHRYFASSPVHSGSLKSWQTNLKEPHRNVLRHVPTRWLSRHRVVDNLRSVIKSVLCCLKEQKAKKDIDAAAYFSVVASFKFLSLLHHLNDILKELHKVSTFFQRSTISFSEVGIVVETLITTLKQRYINESTAEELKYGEHYKAFYEEVKDRLPFFPAERGEPVTFDYGGVDCIFDISKSQLDRELKSYVSTLVENLEERFDDEFVEFWDNASVLDPEKLPKDLDASPSYGCSNFIFLTKHFKANLDKHKIDVPVNEDKIKKQWTEFLPIFKKLYKGASKVWEEQLKEINSKTTSNSTITPPYSKMLLTWRSVFSSDTLKANFPLVIAIAMRVLVIPLCSVECERGFSQQNLIRTKHRSCLETSTLDSLMRIAMTGPPFKSLSEEFIWDVFLAWKGARTYRYLLSNRSGRTSGTKYHLLKTGGVDNNGAETLEEALPPLEPQDLTTLEALEISADELKEMQDTFDAFGIDDN